MWLMLPTGALSIVERSHVEKDDPRDMVVRARRKEWINAFRKYCPELGPTLHLKNRDYQYRAYVKRDDLAAGVAKAVMAISYPNFKSATLTPKHGLRSAKLRNSLHTAYNKVWNDLLDAGDGTSVYDFKHWKPTLTGIEACRRWGHWWPKGADKCKDCGEPNPSYPDAGPLEVFPDDPPAKPVTSKPRKQASAKPEPEPPWFVQDKSCPGSWSLVDPVTFEIGTEGEETAQCGYCGQREEMTLDGRKIRLHYPEEVSVS